MKKLKKIGIIVLFILTGCTSSLQTENIPLINADIKPAITINNNPAKTFFPIDPDFVWQYDVVFHPADDPYVDYKGTYTLKVEKSKKKNEQTVLILRGMDTLNNEYHFPEITMDKDNVSIKGVDYFGFGAVAADDLNIDFLHLPLKLGNSWDDGLWTGKVKSVEKVSVPAGTFEAWKIDSIGTYNQAYTAVGNYWVVPGIGIVKSELNTPGWQIESQLILAGPQKKK